MDDARAVIERLELKPHPEGGWFRRTWTSPIAVDTPNGARPAGTCIHYLLQADERSEWHVVTSDELWLWHCPGRLELSLGPDPENPGRYRVDPAGKRAVTDFRVLEGPRVELRPQTGRSHQLRIHMAAGLGLPIRGDGLYGKPGPRLMLHCCRLGDLESPTPF